MRTSEQTFWHWATRGIGGAVTIVEFLADDNIPPSVEALAELTRQHSRITDLIIKGERLYRQATGEKTKSEDQANENEQRLTAARRQPVEQSPGEQVLKLGDTDQPIDGPDPEQFDKPDYDRAS